MKIKDLFSHNKQQIRFKVHHKQAVTNINTKTTPCTDFNIIKSVFKGFLHRAQLICSEKYIKAEERF